MFDSLTTVSFDEATRAFLLSLHRLATDGGVGCCRFG